MINKSKDLSAYRREYLQGGLRRKDLAADPMHQFDIWFEQANAAELPDANAMSLATVTPQGCPQTRIVLLKAFGPQGFVFYTNYGSNKAQEIAQNACVALHFAWLPLERQIRITGKAVKTSAESSAKYFHSRPLKSQLGAIASKQSQPLAGRKELEQEYLGLLEKYADGEVPTPDYWGGYCVEPERIEFWQGGAHRLHDRFVYVREGEVWSVNRLAP